MRVDQQKKKKHVNAVLPSTVQTSKPYIKETHLGSRAQNCITFLYKLVEVALLLQCTSTARLSLSRSSAPPLHACASPTGDGRKWALANENRRQHRIAI